MADKKITELTEGTTLATGDFVPFVDVSDTTDAASGTTKKTLISTITTYLASLTQTLTNKTVTATTNNVAAKSLHSASTVVDVSAATAPSSGQVLTATSSTAATWQTPTGLSDKSVRVKQSAATALTTSWVSCAFGAEDFDTDTMHDNSTNNTRITFNTAGKYCVGGTIQVSANTILGARIRLNGTTVLCSEKQGNSGAIEQVAVSTIYNFAGGDYVELQGYASSQNSSGDSDTNFWAYKIF